MIQKRFYISSWTHGHLLALDVYEYPVQGNWDEYLYRDISEEDYEDCYQEAVKWRDDIIEEISSLHILPIPLGRKHFRIAPQGEYGGKEVIGRA